MRILVFFCIRGFVQYITKPKRPASKYNPTPSAGGESRSGIPGALNTRNTVCVSPISGDFLDRFLQQSRSVKDEDYVISGHCKFGTRAALCGNRHNSFPIYVQPARTGIRLSKSSINPTDMTGSGRANRDAVPRYRTEC